MYRSGVTFGRKLARLSMPGAVAPDAAPAVDASRPARDARAVAGPAEPAPPPNASAMSVLDQLRAKMDVILSRQPILRPPPPAEQPDLPFITEETPLGPLHRRIVRLPASHRVGRGSVLPSRTADAELLALLALDPGLATCPIDRALYLDTETTGLAGGAGTVAFLVGLAFWDRSAPDDEGDVRAELVVEQLLVRMLGEEAPMLAHLHKRIAEASMLVTFNGKSFDMPLLRTRFVMARIDAPSEPPHLDLLHVARRIHKARGKACRLIKLEDEILGFVRHDDIPSGDVAACYLHFLRTGETASLIGVVEHNLWDVVTMASLVGLYGEPLEGSQLEADDLAGAARVLQRAGAAAAAQAFAHAAVEGGGGVDALRARAEIAKVVGDRDRALADFHAVLERTDDPKARLELAKIYEHHKKDVVRALALAEEGTGEKEEALIKRRRRLTLKVERATALDGEADRHQQPLFAKRDTKLG